MSRLVSLRIPLLLAACLSSEPLALEDLRARLLVSNPEIRSKRVALEAAKMERSSSLLQLFLPALDLKAGAEAGWSRAYAVPSASLTALPSTRTATEASNLAPYLGLQAKQKLPGDGLVTLDLVDKLDMLRSANSLYGAPSRPSAWSNLLSLQVGVVQPLFKRQEWIYSLEKSRRDQASGERDLRKAVRLATERLEGAYWDWCLSIANRKVLEAKLASGAKTLRETENKFQAGLVKEIDLLKIRLSARKAELDRDLAVREELDLRAALLRVTSLDSQPGVEIRFTEPIERITNESLLDSSRYDGERSLAPSVASNDVLLDLADEGWTERMGFEKTAELARPVGSVSGVLQKDLVADDNLSLSLSVNLAFPLFDRGNWIRAVSNHQMARTLEMIRRKDAEAQVARDLTKALRELDAIAKQVESAKIQQALAERIYLIDRERFALGLITSDTLLLTETDFFLQKGELARQAVRWLKAVAALELRFEMVRRS